MEPSILIVEDYEHLSRALVRSVSSLLAHLRHGVVAVSTLDQVTPQLLASATAVITDWSFPLRAGEAPAHGAGAGIVSRCMDAGIPVLVLSGDPRPATYPQGNPAAQWLAKPADRAHLRAFLTYALSPKNSS